MRGLLSLALFGVLVFFTVLLLTWVSTNINKYKQSPEDEIGAEAEKIGDELLAGLQQSTNKSMTLESPRFWMDDIKMEDFGWDISSQFSQFMTLDDIQFLKECNTTSGVLTLIGPEQPEGPEIIVKQQFYYVSARTDGSTWMCVRLCTKKECPTT